MAEVIQVDPISLPGTHGRDRRDDRQAEGDRTDLERDPIVAPDDDGQDEERTIADQRRALLCTMPIAAASCASAAGSPKRACAFSFTVTSGTSPIPSVSYIGTQPTFGQHPRMVEVHLLNAGKRLYGKALRVVFFEWLRGELTFNSKPELIAQIQRDVQQTHAYFETQRRRAQTTSVHKEKA